MLFEGPGRAGQGWRLGKEQPRWLAAALCPQARTTGTQPVSALSEQVNSKVDCIGLDGRRLLSALSPSRPAVSATRQSASRERPPPLSQTHLPPLVLHAVGRSDP
jgi:hypothetical protein